MKKIDDILTQLQQQPTVSHPDELADRIMDSLPDMDAQPDNDKSGRRSTRRARLYIFSAIAVAASILLLLMLNVNQDIKEGNTIASSEKVRMPREQISQVTEKDSVPDRKISDTPVNICRKPSVVAKVRKKKQIDSLDYYIAKIERELTQVDESLYIDRMQKLIHADERLQRIVNNYLFHQLDKDGRPIEAINTNHVSTTENEE